MGANWQRLRVQPAPPTPTPTKTTETVLTPTPGPNSLVLSRDVFVEVGHQGGEIQLAPGDTFSVNLASYKAYDRIWGETPEIINEGVVELVSYKSSPADIPVWQTWNFKVLGKGSCMVYFKTGKSGLEIQGWAYVLSVVVTSSPVSTFPVEYTLVTTSSEMTDNATDMKELVYTFTARGTFEVHGTLEGKMENITKEQIDLMTGGWWARVQSTFTGTVNGKSGTLTLYKVMWGKVDSPDYTKGWEVFRGTVVSGTVWGRAGGILSLVFNNDVSTSAT